MLRRISTIAASAAMLALSALPASAAAMSSSTHKLSFPSLSGVSAWGTYSNTGSRVKVNVCAEDTIRGEFAAAAVVVAYNASYSHSSKGGAVDIGYHQTQCVSMTLLYTAHLRIYTFVGGSNGKVVRQSKTKVVY